MVKSIFEQTGFIRKHPEQLIQDSVLVARITEYDFNLRDKDFLIYLSERGVIDFVEYPENEITDVDIDVIQETHNDWLMEHPNFEVSEEGYRYTHKERVELVAAIILLKGSIQDAWELYKESEVF